MAQYNTQVHLHMTTCVQNEQTNKTNAEVRTTQIGTHSNISKKDIIFHHNIYMHTHANIIWHTCTTKYGFS